MRAEQARASRRAILDAALTLFARDGYAATTLVAVGDEAGVAVETIYKHFKNKPALVQHLLAREVAGTDSAVDAPHGLTADQIAEQAAETDPVQRLQRIAALAAGVYARTAPVEAIFAEAAGAEPALREQWRENRARRVRDVRDLLAGLDAALAVPVDDAVDITWTLAGPELFRMLTQERGWSVDRYQRWLFTTLRGALLKED